MEEEYNNKTIEIIINLIKIYNSNEDEFNDYEIYKSGIRYLLGQTLRQLIIPKSKHYLSYEASKLWRRISLVSDERIFEKYYTDRVCHNNELAVEVKTYKGASNTPRKRNLNKDDTFSFREVFHDDHIIPMNMIVKQLLELEDLNRSNVMDIIKNISICRMLKSEDRRIKEKRKRTFNELEIVEKLYSKYGIYVINYKYSLINPDFLYEFDESIHLRIPKVLVKSYEPHPEEHGDKLVELYNGMITDVYTDENGILYSITNNNLLIQYVTMQQELIGHASYTID